MKNPVIASLAILLACNAGAILPEHVEVAYTPALAQPAHLSPTAVTLQINDNRHAESPDWIADKKNGYGMRLANVLAQKPVADLVRDALTQELSARGVTVGQGLTVITADITRLESVYQNRFFSIGAIGYADLAVQVRRLNGSILYARNFSTSNDTEAGLAGTAGQARRSLEQVLSNVVGQLMADPAFTAALSAPAVIAS